MEHDKLIKQLRFCAELDAECEHCERIDQEHCVEEMMNAAADMIAALKEANPLPCKVGDTVYIIGEYDGYPDISETNIYEVSMHRDSVLFCCEDGDFYLTDWLKDVFPTHEAAAAELMKRETADEERK